MGMGLLHHEYVSLCGQSYIRVIQGLTRLHFDSTLWKMTIWQFENNYYLGRSMYEMDVTNEPYASSALTRQKISILSNFFYLKYSIQSGSQYRGCGHLWLESCREWKRKRATRIHMVQSYLNWSSFFAAELKMDLMRERELRENLEKQLIDEQRNKSKRNFTQFTHHWPFVRGIHRFLVDSPHKGSVIQSFALKIG